MPRGPVWFRDLLPRGQSEGRETVLVAWNRHASSLPDVDQFFGVVAVNCPGFSTGILQDAGFSYVRRFAVLPSLMDARWFIPLDTPTLSAAAFQLYTPYQPLARLKRFGAQALARTGSSVWYRDQVWIAQRGIPPIEQTIRALFPGSAVRLALSSGTLGPARKPTLAVLGRDGQALAFGKVSRSALSSRLMQHEAEALRALASRVEPAPVAPPLLYSGKVEDAFVTMQGVLAGHPAPPRITPAHHRFLASLRTAERKSAARTALVTSLRCRAAALPAPRPDLLALFDTLMPALERLTLPSTIVHGDFAPWNLREHHGALAAFDWEYAERDGLPLVDEVYHLLQVGLNVGGWTAEHARDRLAELAAAAPLGLRPEEIRVLEIVAVLGALLGRLDKTLGDDESDIVWYRRLLGYLASAMDVEMAA